MSYLVSLRSPKALEGIAFLESQGYDIATHWRSDNWHVDMVIPSEACAAPLVVWTWHEVGDQGLINHFEFPDYLADQAVLFKLTFG